MGSCPGPQPARSRVPARSSWRRLAALSVVSCTCARSSPPRRVAARGGHGLPSGFEPLTVSSHSLQGGEAAGGSRERQLAVAARDARGTPVRSRARLAHPREPARLLRHSRRSRSRAVGARPLRSRERVARRLTSEPTQHVARGRRRLLAAASCSARRRSSADLRGDRAAANRGVRDARVDGVVDGRVRSLGGNLRDGCRTPAASASTRRLAQRADLLCSRRSSACSCALRAPPHSPASASSAARRSSVRCAPAGSSWSVCAFAQRGAPFGAKRLERSRACASSACALRMSLLGLGELATDAVERGLRLPRGVPARRRVAMRAYARYVVRYRCEASRASPSRPALASSSSARKASATSAISA